METLEKTPQPRTFTGSAAFPPFLMQPDESGKMVPVAGMREVTMEASAIAMSDECYRQHLKLVEKQQEQDALQAERQHRLNEKRLDYAHSEKMSALGIQILYMKLSFSALVVAALLVGFLAFLQMEAAWIGVASGLVTALCAYLAIERYRKKGK